MNVVERVLNGLVVYENRQFPDNRGYFEEYFNLAKFKESGLDFKFVQVNHSRSLPGVIRGLHFQNEPAQAKLVGVTRGRIWDVAVDVRVGSPTRGQYFGVELSGENGRLLFIPAGFAHGFYVLGTEPADVLYLVDSFYNAKTEQGLRWNDEDLKIPWPLDRDPIVSERDRAQISWREFNKA